MTIDGLIVFNSDFDPRQTMDRLADAVANRGMTILACIDHAAAAHDVGMQLRPTEVLIFGNPKAGSPLMSVAQTLGIDLPLRVLVWQDADGKTWLACNDPHFVARRHGIESEFAKNLDAMAKVLDDVAHAATQRQAGEAP